MIIPQMDSEESSGDEFIRPPNRKQGQLGCRLPLGVRLTEGVWVILEICPAPEIRSRITRDARPRCLDRAGALPIMVA